MEDAAKPQPIGIKKIREKPIRPIPEKTSHVQINSDYANLTSLQALMPVPVNQNVMEAKAVRDAVNAVNQSELLGFDRELRFSTDPQSKLPIVQVLNRGTGEIIVQLPSEFVLGLAEMLRNRN